MNKLAYRLIFSPRRGMLVAVAENVSSQGKGAQSGSAPGATHSPLMRFAKLTVAIVALFGGATFVQAQIVADPNAGNRRPTVTQTANGIPLVNIVAPNGAGVSQNQYTQFSAGNAVLNNSATSVQTQQAGWVPGNANLTPGNSARIILNEVTGTSRSQLNGYIEVAGQKAQVVIANVNGISCSGCGFINTSRGVLTTGTPVFGGDGSLNAFRVTRGDIQIDGGGLNGNNLDQLDLIARSVSVNGQLWANNLNVVAGANVVNYADLGVQVIQGDDGKPTVGIDVASIGGMYANKIKLVGTEAGVGVVSLGNIAAQAGDLNIDNQGMITLNGKTTASGQVRIVGNDGITNTGTLYGQQAVQLYSAGQIANSGTVAAQSDLGLFSGSINSTGALGAGVDANGHATQAGSISLTAAGNITATGQNTASTDIEIGGASVNLTHGQINAGRNVGLTARAGDIDQTGATLQATGTATINATGALSNDQGSINAAQIGINAGSLSNTGGSISQSGTGDTSIVTAGALNNAGTIATNANNLSIQSGSLSNNGGQINHAGTGTTSIQTGTFSNTQGAIATNGAASITAGAATNNGSISAQQTLDLTATSLNNNGGTLASNAAMAVNAGSQLSNSGGTIQAGTTASPSSVQVTAANLDNSGGTLGAGTIDLEATNLINAAGKIIQNNTNGTATINVSQLLNNSTGMIGVVANNVTVAAGSINNDHGSIAQTGTGALTVNTGALSNNAGVLGTNGAAIISASSIANQGGKLTAVGNESVTSASTIDNSQGGYIGGAAVAVNATAGQVNNQGGTIEGATAGATVNAQSINNAAGKIQNLGTGAVAVTVAQALNNAAGSISGKGAVTASAASIDNTAGAIGALGDLSVSSASTLDNTNGSIEAMGNVAATAQGALTNVGGKIEALGAAGQLQVAGSTVDNTNGKIINVGTGLTTVTGTTSITNADPSGVTGAGLIGGAGDVTIGTPTLSNTQGGHIVAGGALNLNTTTSVDNTAGQLLATGALTMHQPGATLTNVSGGISGGSVALTTASIDNTNGSIANPAGSGGGVSIATGAFTNTNGSVGSDVDLTLAASTLTGDGKIVAGRDGNVSLQGDYTYDAGNQITANRNLTLSTTGNLVNTGTLAAAGNLSLNAANVWNAAGADIASGNPGDTTTGTTTINAGAGGIVNAGRIEGNNVNTTSNQLGNTGTLIGNTVTVNANTVTNDGAAAIIAGVNQVNLWVANTVTNQNGATLYSLGDLNIAANGAKDANGYLFNQTGTINNLSSTIEADGTLNIAANQINNVRQNVTTNTVTVSDTTSTMTQSSWWTSLSKGSTPTRNGNTQMHDAYYLDPASILSVTPMVTPDGYLIYKAVVKLSANDSAFEIMNGGLTYLLPNGAGDVQYNSQSRVTATAGTQVIYFTRRNDNQVNPDQVAGNSAWSDYSNYIFRNTLGSITYSNQYGNCTTNCVRLLTIPDYTDPTTTFQNDTQLRHAYFPGSYPMEVERIAHQVVTETQLAPTTGAPAKITSGGDIHMAIGTQLNNNNGQIAAGGNLTIDGVASADGSNNTKILNTSTKLTQTYSSTNQSGFGTADSLPAPPVEWTTWSNTPITLDIGVAGGTITSNQAVSITGGQVSNTSVGASTRPIGASAGSLGLGDGIVPISLVGNGSLGSISPLVPGAARVVDGARAGAVNTVLPTNGLYSVRPQPNQPYLIATDPRFTQYGNFISSDYMLNLLGINPAGTQKRLGDGFYEEKLVTDQVTNLTGMRYLNGYTSAENEYKVLMTNGVAFAKQFNMEPGMALSDAQMAALTTDIVWLVSQTVTLPDGSQQTVLVPQVYLAKNMDLTPTGALIAGDSVGIKGTDITNTGGTLSGKQQLLLAADHDISNIGGTLSGGNVGLFAGNNILDQSVTNTAISNFGNNSSTVTAVGAVGKIAATNNLVMSAGQNLTLQGAQVGAGGNAMLMAGNAINVETVSTGSHYATQAGNTHTDTQSTHAVGSTVAAGGNLGVMSGGDTTITGSNLSSGKDMLVAAGGNLTIQNAVDSSSYHTDGSSKDGSQVIAQHNQTTVGSNLSAGGDATVVAGAQQDAFGNVVLTKGAPAKDLIITASTITAGNNPNSTSQGTAALGATGNVTIGEAMLHNDFSQEDKSSHKGFMSSSSSHDVRTMTGDVAQGSTVAGNQVSITAANDLTVRGSNVIGLNDVSLSAINGNVGIVSVQDSSQTNVSHEQKKSGFTAGFSAGVASVGYGKSSGSSDDSVQTVTQQGSSIASINGNTSIQAGQDLKVVASDISAGQNLTLIGKNVDLSAAQNTSVEHSAQQSSSSGLSVGLTLNPVAAFKSAYQQSASGNPSTSVIGRASKYGDAIGDGTLAASTPVVVQAGSHSSSGNQDHATSTAQVSSLTAGNNLTVLATGGSINSQGTSMSANGDATLIAKDNINLDVAHSFESQGQNNTSKGWSLDNRGSLPAGVFNGKGNGNGSTDTVTGTTLSAGGKAMLATTDGDINLTASNLVATSDLSINAARNLTIQSGQNTATNANQNNSQAIGKVVISDTERFAGYSADKSKNNDTSVTQVASNVGSLQGNVNLSAGEKYTQTASNVLAAQDINIVAKSIDINTAANTGNSDQSTSDLKVGAFARVTSPLIDLGNNLENAKKSDGRLQAMQGLAAASNGYQAASAASAALGGSGSGELLKAEVGVGFTTANSKDRSNYSQAQGSSIQGGGNVNLTTTEGDIHATGAHIAAGDAAGKTLTLDSARNILLDAGQSTVTSSGSNHSAGVEVGVGYEVGAKTGVYAYIAANVGNGNYDNTATTNSNTQLSGNTVTLKSKGDTTLTGATVKADTINADVGGALAITSVQDTATQHNEQNSVGGRVQISFGTAWEASGSLSQSNANGTSNAVNQQSGLFAGNGGYHVNADTVALKGGAIASTNAGKSDLTANALTVENITNKMDYSADTASISGGVGGSLGGSNSGKAPTQTSTGASNPNVTPGIPLFESGGASSTTYGTLTDGNINIGGQHMTSSAGVGAHTDLATANAAIAPLPDLKNVMNNQQAMAAAANTVIATSAQIANDIGAAADKKNQQAQAVLDNPDSTQAQKDQAQQDAKDAQATLKNWGPTGDYTRDLKVVTAILVGGVAGQGAGQLAANASAPFAANAIGDYFAQPGHENQTAQVLTHAVLGAILAAANGGSAAAGAGAGASGELAAQEITRQLYPTAYDADGTFHPEKLDANQLNTVIGLSTAVGALVGGMTGGSALNADVGANIAQNAATNNWLSPKGNVIRNIAKSACDNGDSKACAVVTAFDDVDKATKKQLDDLVASCNGGKGSADACTQAGQIINTRNAIAKQELQSCPVPYNCLAQYQPSANENSAAYGPGMPGWGSGSTTPTADPITAAVLIRMGLLKPDIALASAFGGGGAETLNQYIYGNGSFDLERIANAALLSWGSGGLGAQLSNVYAVAGVGAITGGATTAYNNSQSGSKDSVLGTSILGWMFGGMGKAAADVTSTALNGALNFKPYVQNPNVAAILQPAAGTPIRVFPTNSVPFLVKDLGGAALPGASGFVDTPQAPASKK